MRRTAGVAGGLLCVGMMLAAATPAAATARCIEASRYTTLAQITAGDLDRLSRDLGAPDHRQPPEGACRAVLLSGRIDAAMVGDLLKAVDQNKGWLAFVYLTASDGDVDAEVKLATIMRAFGLAGFLMMTDLDYTIDFLQGVKPFPASVSYAWTVDEGGSARTTNPIQERLAAYDTDVPRHLERGASVCGRGCGTLLAGAVDRHQVGVFGPHMTAEAAPVDPVQTPRDAELRAAARRAFSLGGVSQRRATAWIAAPTITQLAPVAREEIDRACRSRADYAGSVAASLARAAEDAVAKDAQHIKLDGIVGKVHALVGADAGIRSCQVQALDRARFASFDKLCQGHCTPDTLKTAIDVESERLVRAVPAAPTPSK